MSLVILTKSPKIGLLSIEFYKNSIKSFIYHARGPQAVTQSLISGLDEIKFDYKLNPKIEDIKENDFVWVNESLDALKLSINLKKTRRIKKLIIGPNIVVTPDDKNKIIQDKNIDVCLVPSKWVKDFYNHFGSEEFRDKLNIWPAGVSFQENKNENKEFCLVYKKDIDNKFFDIIIEELKRRNIKYIVIEYGKYKREDYLNLLNRTNFMIYLQNIESQGIAMLEAWEKNVPTLVYYNNKYNNKDVNIFGNISAPYLNDQSGVFFDDNNFNEKLDYLLDDISNFKPREYIEQNFTNRLCSEKFLELIK